jgi:hypothetical protein
MGRTGHVAAVTFWPRTATPEDVALAEAARRRRTDRREVTSWPVPQGWFDKLKRLALEHGVLATGDLPEDQRREVGRQLGIAARQQAMNEAYLDELMAWTHRSGDAGIPAANVPDRREADRLASDAAPTRFPAGTLVEQANDEGMHDAQWLVLSTTADDPVAWVRTGEALSALWLYCTTEGLSLVPHTQPVEVESVRVALGAHLLEDRGIPQILLRVGWPPVARSLPPQTPRRPVEEVLES